MTAPETYPIERDYKEREWVVYANDEARDVPTGGKTGLVLCTTDSEYCARIVRRGGNSAGLFLSDLENLAADLPMHAGGHLGVLSEDWTAPDGRRFRAGTLVNTVYGDPLPGSDRPVNLIRCLDKAGLVL